MFSLRFRSAEFGSAAAVVLDIGDLGEVVDVVVGMRAEDFGDIDCEGGEWPSAAVCNDRCGMLSGNMMLERRRNSDGFETDLDTYMVFGFLRDCLT